MDICFLSARELARRIHRKELSAREVVDAHLKQIDRINPQLNAMVTLVADAARKQAADADEAAAHGKFWGPLHGLPVAFKDLHETKGIRTTFGSPVYRDYVPNFNRLIVERTQNAGAITMGKTNTPEFGAGSQTLNTVFGPTRNPWDLTKTCGGSSGGTAVALACGMVALADGSDHGGSLRNPASFCSIAGMRPSPGRVPNIPAGNGWSPQSVAGPMARNIEDLALYLSAIAGPDARAPLSIHEPGLHFAPSLGREMKGLKIAWCESFAGLPFDKRVIEVMSAQRAKFESLGCITEDADPDFTGADEGFKILRALLSYQSYAPLLEEHSGQIKATLRAEIEQGSRLTVAQISHGEMLRSAVFARIGEFMTRYDFMVLPVSQVPPFPIEQEYPMEVAGQRMKTYIDWMRSCYFISMTGLPAVSVPAGFTPEVLPVGLQIVGRHHDDFGTLQMAYAFEQMSGVHGRIPAVALA